MITLKNKIKLKITKKLLQQIKFLCRNIWEVEWSGVLFYSVQGEFGSPEFQCTAEHILFMDKGSSSYTEFDSDESVAEFMMDNPEYFEKRQGLIHSHCTFGVFFSGTDNDEIKENSANHNYYLSLIVNNKGDMCAKIAFRGETEEIVKKTINFKGTNGENKTTIIETIDKKEVVYIYDCEIEEEIIFEVGESFIQRYNNVIEKDEAKKKAIEAAKTKNISSNKYNKCSKWDNKQYAREFEAQPSLFTPDIKKSAWDNIGAVPSDTAINEFLKKVIAVDAFCVESVADSLKKLKAKFGKDLKSCNNIELEIYLNHMKDNLEILYTREFGNLIGYGETLELMVLKLESWVTINWVAEMIQYTLNLAYDEVLSDNF